MRSSSDGAMGRRALAPLDADIMELLKNKLNTFRAHHPTSDPDEPGTASVLNWSDSSEQIGCLPLSYQPAALAGLDCGTIQSHPAQETAQIDPTIDDLDFNYPKLHVRVKASVPAEQGSFGQLPKGIVSWSQLPKVSPNSTLGKIIHAVDSVHDFTPSPRCTKECGDHDDGMREAKKPVAKHTEGGYQEDAVPMCMNIYWGMWITGFIFPALWICGVSGLCSGNPCGFAAGMANSVTLLVAAILVVIFFA